MNTSIRLHVAYVGWGHRSIGIWIVRNNGKIHKEDNSSEIEIYEFGKNGILDLREVVGEMSDCEPSLKLDPILTEMLIDGLGELNIKPKKESFVEGNLESTKYHLEDLRKLLKLK